MNDPEARFARRLGLMCGRWDWWRIRDEHTPYEWALQLAGNAVEPMGDERADLRAATNTLGVMQSMAEIKEPESLFNALAGYLKVNQPQEQIAGPNSAARMMGR